MFPKVWPIMGGAGIVVLACNTWKMISDRPENDHATIQRDFTSNNQPFVHFRESRNSPQGLSVHSLKKTMDAYIRPCFSSTNSRWLHQVKGSKATLVPLLESHNMHILQEEILESCGPRNTPIPDLKSTAADVQDIIARKRIFSALATNDEFVTLVVEQTFRSLEQKHGVPYRDEWYSYRYDQLYPGHPFREFVDQIVPLSCDKIPDHLMWVEPL